MKLKRIICALGMAIGLFGHAQAQNSFEGYEITPEGAWCWFADPRALHYENSDGSINSSYIGYIDVHGNIKAMQYNFVTGERNEVLIRSYFQPDDHDNPTFLVLPDERIMIFYSRHTDEACFYYRVSQKKGDITSLGEEKKIITANNTTYPSPFILSDDPTHIYLCWRGINWHPTIAKLSIPDADDNLTVEWGPYQMVQSTGARPYAKYQSNGKDKILVSYTTGHPDNEYPNYLYFNYININSLTLEDVNGNTLSTIANGAFNVSKNSSYVSNYPATIVDNTSDRRDWLWQVVECEDGNPAIAMVKINNGKTSHDYYYAKWNGSEWVKTFLINGGGHFHQTASLEMCYSGGMTIDPDSTNIIYCSAPVTGDNGKVYEILKLTVNSDGSVSQEAITKNSKLGNSRPYILPGSAGSPLRLAWMHGNYYDWIVSNVRSGYPTAINCDYNYVASSKDITAGLVKAFTFDDTEELENATVNEGKLVLSNDKVDTQTEVDGNSFSVSISPCISESAYYGTILTIGDMEYGLDSESMKPYVKIGNVTYESTNVLGTADCWANYSRGTSGTWYTPSKLEDFNLTITLSDSVLTVYRNGLIDQRIYLSGDYNLKGNVVLGGFSGTIEDCRIYSRAINQEEIKELTDILIYGGELQALSLASEIYSDVYLPTESKSGYTISWTSSNEDILPTSGLVNYPDEPTELTVTASIDDFTRTFDVTVYPRDIDKCLQIYYTFDEEDVYTTEDGETKVSDKSGNGRDVTIMGSAKVDGTLNLTSNSSNFSSNGYAIAPEGSLNPLRSYTFFVKVKPSNLNKLPRIYDFGSSAYNSVFGRASGLTGGVKYNGGSTAMVNSSTQLSANTETCVAFTFDAKTSTTKIYVNGVQTGSGTNIVYAPCQLLEIGDDTRNYIGRAQWWDTSESSNNYDFCGTIDDFYTYNVALTQEEIQNLYNIATNINKISKQKGQSLSLSSTICSQGETINATTDKDFSGKVQLNVISASGKLINTKSLNENEASFNAPSAPGLYVVLLQEDGKLESTAKLFVK